MLVGVFGLIGSGKSLLLADIAEKAIKGKKIYHNGFGAFSRYDRVYTKFSLVPVLIGWILINSVRNFLKILVLLLMKYSFLRIVGIIKVFLIV